MDDEPPLDERTARSLIDRRRAELRVRLDDADRRLVAVRRDRAEWTDEEHDPEGFAATFEWSQAQGARDQQLRELAALDAAEARVTRGAYGICDRCGRPIPQGQLELRPARTACVRC